VKLQYSKKIIGLLYIFCFSIPIFVSSLSFASFLDNTAIDRYQPILDAKQSLERGDYEKTIIRLNTAIDKFPFFEDYLLFWRAQAYEGLGEINKALIDLKALSERHKDSPIIKRVKIKEAELYHKRKDDLYLYLLEALTKEYPQDLNIKYTYAVALKENKDMEKAKSLFKEIFQSASPLSKKVITELSDSDITAEDLLKKGENLNKAWLFKEAEDSLQEALKKKPNEEIKKQILEALAYSVFRQKRYKESASLYKEVNNYYWRARSLIRAKDLNTFESELDTYLKKTDKRIVKVLLSYGTRLRREGNIKKALEIFNMALSKYPSEKEDILWTIAWTHYISGDYKKSVDLFSHLYEDYKNSKYHYWMIRAQENLDSPTKIKISLPKIEPEHRDYYGYLLFMRESKDINLRLKNNNSEQFNNIFINDRFEILKQLGMRQELVSEIIATSKKITDPKRLIDLAFYLKNQDMYKQSISLTSRLPYNEELHPILYPLAYISDVENASKKNNIDPLLILSIIREESRFDKEARSIAGALGLMQLMPQTAQRLQSNININLKKTEQLYEPSINISIGAYYLKKLINMFNSVPIAIAAYNAGEEAVDSWLKSHKYKAIDEFIEDIPFNETRNYVKNVLTTYFEYQKINPNKSDNLEILFNINFKKHRRR
jgi:soluble lytic murein transglycosylase